MNTSIKYFLLILIVLSLTSCEDVIQVKLDKGTPLVTVDAFVNDMRSQQKIRLTYTDNYFSNKKNDPIIGASVSIKDSNTGQVFNFTDNSNGNYVFNLAITDTIGRINHTYELSVNFKGTTYTSLSKMNRTAQVDSIDVEYRDGSKLGEPKGYHLKFLGFDKPGVVPDYYWIKSYRNGVYFNQGNSINLACDGAYSHEADGFPFIPPISYNIAPDGVFQKYDICRVEIHSINEQTWNMFYQVQAQISNSGLFATTPENVKTNIISNDTKIKVVGWFCMSSVGFREKVVL